MKKRVLTSIIIVLIVAAVIACKFLPYSIGDYIFDIFLLILAIIAGIEMCNIFACSNKSLNKFMASMYSIFNYVILLFSLRAIEYYLLPIIELCALIVYYLIALIVESSRNKNYTFKEKSNSALNTMLACIYPGFILCLLLMINHSDIYAGIQYFSVPFIIIIFAITWLTDTFAFLIGSLIKGPKLAPSLSPNKTISGAIGGLLGGIIGAMLTYVLVYFTPVFQGILSNFNLTWWMFLIVGIVTSVFAQMGDLFESKLKRIAGIKDSGNIIPGHGGMLDRIDAMIFATFIIYIFTLGIIA